MDSTCYSKKSWQKVFHLHTTHSANITVLLHSHRISGFFFWFFFLKLPFCTHTIKMWCGEIKPVLALHHQYKNPPEHKNKCIYDVDAQAQGPLLHVKDPPPLRTQTMPVGNTSQITADWSILFSSPDERGSFLPFSTCKNVQKMGATILYSNMCDLLVVIISQCQPVKCIFSISV